MGRPKGSKNRQKIGTVKELLAERKAREAKYSRDLIIDGLLVLAAVLGIFLFMGWSASYM